ncbi:histidine--tRNA ligase [Candidatus Parcubacteria bacterium]|nr:MAG: histidine--tRNA ligase [Candidatus Parcubacteria bacterium]
MIPKTRKEKSKESGKTFQTPKGMHDVLPGDQPYWDRIERVVRDLAEFYNFARIRTPILEFAELFQRTAGEETDIVRKEMYVFKTKGGDVVTLRPEGTAAVARAYLEHSLGRMSQPQRLFYIEPMFRYENPQAGRYRQHSQAGFEVLGGSNDPIYDAQIITMFQRLLETLRIKNTNLKINSIGCRVCRPLYRRQLQTYYKTHEKDLCSDCVGRLKQNPLRLLDCKEDSCGRLKERVPNVLDKLCSTCSEHFKTVLEYLDELQLPYTLDNQLVRGLDYYNRTVFEISVEGKGSEVGALPGGGRYDYLMELLGGHLTPAVGGACGVDRLVAVMKAQEIKIGERLSQRVFVAHAGELAKKKCLKLVEELRKANIGASEALARESLKAQLKAADRDGAPIALILGQKEIYEDGVIIRDLRSGLQETVPLHRIIDEVRKRLRDKNVVEVTPIHD